MVKTALVKVVVVVVVVVVIGPCVGIVFQNSNHHHHHQNRDKCHRVLAWLGLVSTRLYYVMLHHSTLHITCLCLYLALRHLINGWVMISLLRFGLRNHETTHSMC